MKGDNRGDSNLEEGGQQEGKRGTRRKAKRDRIIFTQSNIE